MTGDESRYPTATAVAVVPGQFAVLITGWRNR